MAASGSRHVFTLDDIMTQSQCWNCRGLGHVRTACPSADGTRSIGHIIIALQSTGSYRGSGAAGKAKGKGKGKGAGRGSSGRGRSAAGRGKRVPSLSTSRTTRPGDSTVPSSPG